MKDDPTPARQDVAQAPRQRSTSETGLDSATEVLLLSLGSQPARADSSSGLDDLIDALESDERPTVVVPVVAKPAELPAVPALVAPLQTRRARITTLAAPPALPPPRSFGALWTVLALGAAGALVWVVASQRHHNAESAAAAQRQAAEAEAMTAKLTAELPDPGAIRIVSDPEQAAVWLSLGRTPLDSMALPTDKTHQLRVELEGHRAVDVDVGAVDWHPHAGATLRADEGLTLTLGTSTVPAMPPPPAAAPAANAGRGVIHVETTPPGAAVWMLVGVTNHVELSGIEAGRDYDLRISKDGFVAGFVHIAAEDWRSGGDPTLPLSAAPKKSIIERAVTLLPSPGSSAAPAKAP